MNIYTIGFTQKSAEQFFELLEANNIKCVLDIRLNNSSQLAGFTKGTDLKYFLHKILDVKYYHDIMLSPTKQILSDYKKNKISWDEYEKLFLELLDKRDIKENVILKYGMDLDKVCLLCSEPTADKCHRRLVSEYLGKVFPEFNINIVHL